MLWLGAGKKTLQGLGVVYEGQILQGGKMTCWLGWSWRWEVMTCSLARGKVARATLRPSPRHSRQSKFRAWGAVVSKVMAKVDAKFYF